MVKVCAKASEAFGVETVEAASADPCIEHEADVFEHLEVLRHSGTGYRKRAGDLVDGHGPAREPLKDGHAGAIGEGIESGL